MAQSALRALAQKLMQGGPAPSDMASYQTAIQNDANRPQPRPMGQQVADVLGGVVSQTGLLKLIPQQEQK